MKQNYHHGNLKQELIEKSIEIISEQGFEALSVRKISMLCGVSHNAVYRHFKSKEQLIEVCRDFATAALMEVFEQENGKTGQSCAETLRHLMAAYISFYEKNPTYFSLLYRNSREKLIFSKEETDLNYPPLEMFRKVYFAYGKEKGFTSKECLEGLIKLWALLHGLTALVISPNVQLDENWRNYINDIIK